MVETNWERERERGGGPHVETLPSFLSSFFFFFASSLFLALATTGSDKELSLGSSGVVASLSPSLVCCFHT